MSWCGTSGAGWTLRCCSGVGGGPVSRVCVVRLGPGCGGGRSSVVVGCPPSVSTLERVNCSWPVAHYTCGDLRCAPRCKPCEDEGDDWLHHLLVLLEGEANDRLKREDPAAYERGEDARAAAHVQVLPQR